MELGIENILDESQVEDLFSNDSESIPVKGEDNQDESNEKQEPQKAEITEVDGDKLFDKSESVGNEDEDIEDEEDSNEQNEGHSPNFYSSITQALVDEGVLQNLNDDDVKDITDAASLRDAIKNEIQSGLDEQQKRINEALGLGVNADDIKRYENTISYLNNIDDRMLVSEGNDGINLRKQLIYQDLLNRGYSQQKAERELQKSFNQGTDIDDAKDALEANKQFFSEQYQDILDEAKESEEENTRMQEEEAEDFRRYVMDSDSFLGIKVNDNMKRKIYDNVTNPIYEDRDGNRYTELQRYQAENKEEFLKTVSAIYTLTDGFKDFSQLSKQAVTAERKRGLASLENVINNTSRTPSGSLKLATGVSEDPDAFYGGFDLDI